jgi:hypothetical protein
VVWIRASPRSPWERPPRLLPAGRPDDAQLLSNRLTPQADWSSGHQPHGPTRRVLDTGRISLISLISLILDVRCRLRSGSPHAGLGPADGAMASAAVASVTPQASPVG